MLIKTQNLTMKYKISELGSGILSKIKLFFKPKYKEVIALDSVNLEINKGEIIGYIGPNGAGKSTTIKLLTGVLVPTSGTVHVNGLIPHKNRITNAFNVGVVYGQRSQLWWDLPLIDSFNILAAMYRIPEKEYRKNLDELKIILELDTFINQPVRKLSLGQRMRGDIAASLLHGPEILYLDEPTIGLDILSKNRILEFIKKINKYKQTTIIFTTHNLSEVEQICERIIILNDGKILIDESKEEILSRFANNKVLIVEFNHEINNIEINNGVVLKKEKNKIWIKFNSEEISAFNLIKSLSEADNIIDVSVKEENIESIVTQIYSSLTVGCANE